VTCEVTLEQKDGGFGLAVELKVSIPGADKEKLQQLVEEAHTVCPYSKAPGVISPVKMTVVLSSDFKERAVTVSPSWRNLATQIYRARLTSYSKQERL